MYRRNSQEADTNYNNIMEVCRQEEVALHKVGEEDNRQVQNRTCITVDGWYEVMTNDDTRGRMREFP